MPLLLLDLPGCKGFGIEERRGNPLCLGLFDESLLLARFVVSGTTLVTRVGASA
jgi:hypothetical protein